MEQYATTGLNRCGKSTPRAPCQAFLQIRSGNGQNRGKIISGQRRRQGCGKFISDIAAQTVLKRFETGGSHG